MIIDAVVYLVDACGKRVAAAVGEEPPRSLAGMGVGCPSGRAAGRAAGAGAGALETDTDTDAGAANDSERRALVGGERHDEAQRQAKADQRREHPMQTRSTSARAAAGTATATGKGGPARIADERGGASA